VAENRDIRDRTIQKRQFALHLPHHGTYQSHSHAEHPAAVSEGVEIMSDRTSQMTIDCRSCQKCTNGSVIAVREMMFGTREEFEYHQCQNCDSLQIANIPNDMAQYYPENYYSMVGSQKVSKSLKIRVREGVVNAIYRIHALGIKSLNSFLPSPRRGDFAGLLAAGARKDDFILDIGCGADAHFLRFLANLGYRNLLGADPFIPQDVVQRGSVRIVKKHLSEIHEKFDIVNLSHSLEHMPKPQEAIIDVARILKPGGRAVIRIPMVSSHAFDIYGADWVQLDAPRHLNLSSRKAILTMFKNSGLTLLKAYDDSTELQFVGSELYKRDLPLQTTDAGKVFKASEIVEFRKRAVALNRKSQGDQASYILGK
jgi:2-polyprenyl-3-methyl-5-hydroxy-6-metoxy-1,4-benzoquinol methylase